MNKLLVGLVALSSMPSFAEPKLSVQHKVVGTYNSGSVTNPEAQIHLAVDAMVSSPSKTQHENWVLSLNANGTFNEVTRPSSKLTADYKVIERMNLGTASEPVQASLYRITVNYNSKSESLENASMVLVKENGEVQIIK